MLASAANVNHVRYGGTDAIDSDFLFHERGLALLDNAVRARRAFRARGRTQLRVTMNVVYPRRAQARAAPHPEALTEQ